MSNSTITKTVFFKAPPETVWDFITKKDKLALWFHPAKADLAEGEDYALVRQNDQGEDVPQCWGKVLRMEAPKYLEYTFLIKPMSETASIVRWTLEEAHGGTRLTLIHEGIDAAGDAALGLLTALDVGWDTHFASLRTAVAE